MDGHCCGGSEIVVEKVIGIPTSGNLPHCPCEHHRLPVERNATGEHHHEGPISCPHPCRDCFCSGALLPIVDLLDNLNDVELYDNLDILLYDRNIKKLLSSYCQQPSSTKTHIWQEYCTSYCRLLL